MFDQSSQRAYAFDFSDDEETEVCDVDEPPVSSRLLFPRGRVDTKDLLMQVRDENERWHRLHPTKLRTACGMTVTEWQAENVRHNLRIEHPLAMCECWTTAEREEADEKFRLGHGEEWKP
jgi:hypothetical protein